MSALRSVFRPDLLAGQVVLVTGGGTGIGRAIAHEVAALGATAFVAARRKDPLRTTVREIEDSGGAADWACVNVREEQAVQALVATVLERHGRLDAVVNNAGGQFPAPAEAISANGWRSVVDLNLTGTFLVVRAAFEGYLRDHGGAVVNVVADMWNGFPYMAHTGAARAAVVNLTKTLAVEWASRAIRVNAVAPGIIWSSGMDTYVPEVREGVSAAGEHIPAGRLGTESEVAATVVFLLSPAAAYITGETIRVDGGASLVPRPLLALHPPRPTPPFHAGPTPRRLPGEASDSEI